MKKNGVTLLILSALASGAGAEGLALAAKAGSTGLGGELTVGLSNSLNLRLGAGGFGYQYDATVAGVDYDLDLSLASGSAALDWHPGGGALRLSGGLLLHGNKLEGLAVPRATVTLGDTTYQANQVGTITSSAEYGRRLAPFATLGFGNGARGGRLFFGFEVGAAFCGRPDVAVSATRSTPGLQADLETEARQIEDDLTWLRTYPIVALSVGIRF